MVWGNFFGNISFILGGLDPCPDGLGHFFGDEVPQSARLSAGGGCKSYLGNAQMPVTLFIMVLPLGWSVLKDWCVDHPPGADRTTCPVRTGPRVQMGRYVQSIYRGPVCVTEVGYRVRGGKSDRTGSKISSTYRGPVCVLGARSCRGPVCHRWKRKNSASSGRLV